MTEIPKGAKKPSDHVTKDQAAAAKAEALGEPLAVNLHGIDMTVDRGVSDDYEVLELIGEADENPGKMTKVFRIVLGVDQYDALKEAVRDEKTGRVSSETMLTLFNDMWEQMGNSPASSGS